MKKRMWIIFVIILIIICSLIFINKNILNINKYSIGTKTIESDSFSISSPELNKILVTISRENGIDKIEYPNGFVVYGKGQNSIAVDYEVESKQEYTFKTTDSNGNETEDTFITPVIHIELTKNDVNVNLENQKQNIENGLLARNIATNFIEFGTGEQSTVSTQTQNVAQIFNNWSSFGDGNWGYNTSNNWIYNTKNSTYFTGYYYPNGNYDSIELSFQAKTTDADDDLIGAMIRFNVDAASTYSTYLFSMDRHDNGGGIGNGAYNGITKLNNSSFSASNLTKLSVNSSLRWTRNTWQTYKFTAKGSKIEAYLNGSLVASAEDDSIVSGTYGFVSLSQAYTYFRNITVTTIKTSTLAEIVESKTWQNEDINIVINYNNSSESLLQSEECAALFNENNIYYIGIGNDDNKEEIEQFITNIGNKGIFTQSSDIENATNEMNDYIKQILE